MPQAAGHQHLDADALHNYGPKCRLAPVARPFTQPDGDGDDGQDNAIPPVNAQFFYTSAIPIDDPLSTSTIAGAADAKSAKGLVLRPFSRGDNNALEKAWLGLASDEYCRNHDQARRNRSPSPSLAKANTERLEDIVHDLAIKHKEKHAREGPGHELTLPGLDTVPDAEAELPLCCQELLSDVGVQLRTSFCSVARKRQLALDRDRLAREVMIYMKTLRTDATASVTRRHASMSRPKSESLAKAALFSNTKENISIAEHLNDVSPRVAGRKSESESQSRRGSQARSPSSATARGSPIEAHASSPISVRASVADDGITGTPFVRVGTPETIHYSPSNSLPRGPSSLTETKMTAEEKPTTERPMSPDQSASEMPSTMPERGRKPRAKAAASVPVGVSRLHEVALPTLQMKPIYWSPINDIAAVQRATWFYNCGQSVGSRLQRVEATYRNMARRAAVRSGSWPGWGRKGIASLMANEHGRSRKIKGAPEPIIPSNPFCAARCFRGEAAAEGNLLPSSNEDNFIQDQSHRKYDQYHVIYKDKDSAFLLKPSLKPSAYYGRRPVAKIAKGITIGIPVVRGFDAAAWAKLHEKKKTQGPHNATHPSSAASASQESTGPGVCPGCRTEKERGQVTDLVLVAHGIGQKLAEKVESYHFTHAINAFRRAVNMELGSDAVRAVLREGQNGIMVLPVNWRQKLSFEEGGPMKEDDKADYMPEGFGLKDIEPPTIPAVRSMISDIMFDIPFYMSHHKPKMIAALVGEANRVYRLWCRNNPGFSQRGRVHIIGHSLGSAMALEILSWQPTLTPPLDLGKEMSLQHFEFDTKNLFLVGSPSAFFLLLERGALIPRRGRRKPGADPADTVSSDVVGEAGQFGCLAVDNVYNVLAREDPVAYFLNGTIDPKYAASLKTAYVPSATTTLLQSMGNAVRSFVPGAGPSAAAQAANPAMAKPAPALRLPSQLELEVHDFTREEVAEKKAFLLNDNGQIDFFLRSGGGPLELQYLNMLSAHSSYWANHDFIRMFCMEIGRKPGKANTLPAMRAMKAKRRALPDMS
ncbi:DDHD domain-containing protein [Apiospora kogelbergensis]|uniref:DDHD domain-containing protein n=1 Tax=Apiospora kogelbergensis TaxID=1337665 RepID=UPI00312F01FD